MSLAGVPRIEYRFIAEKSLTDLEEEFSREKIELKKTEVSTRNDN